MWLPLSDSQLLPFCCYLNQSMAGATILSFTMAPQKPVDDVMEIMSMCYTICNDLIILVLFRYPEYIFVSEL